MNDRRTFLAQSGALIASPLMGAGTATQGVVMCIQPRTVDLVARRGKRVEMAPEHVVDDVLARVTVLLDRPVRPADGTFAAMGREYAIGVSRSRARWWMAAP